MIEPFLVPSQQFFRLQVPSRVFGMRHNPLKKNTMCGYEVPGMTSLEASHLYVYLPLTERIHPRNNPLEQLFS